MRNHARAAAGLLLLGGLGWGCSGSSGGDGTDGVGGTGSTAFPSGVAGTAGLAGSGGTGAGTPAVVAGTGGTGGSGDATTATPPAAAGGNGAAAEDPLGGTEDPVETPAPTPGLFPPVSDFTQAGPYTSTTLVNVGPNSNYTVYMPMEPPPAGAANPIVAWTSGGGTSHVFYTLLPHLASHGFVVVTSNTIPGIGGEEALGNEIIAGIDWIIAENTHTGSPLEGRLDTTKIASTGYSMGSLATFMIASDPRLTTTVHISGGNMAPERVNNLHAPAAFICGIPDPACTDLLSATCDIAGQNCLMDFENATTPVFYARFEYGHLGILTAPYTDRINAMATAWLRYQLMGDTTLEPKFLGPSCEYCSDADWMVQQKGF